MKKNLLLNCLTIVLICRAAAQTPICSVNINGGICTGTTLTANAAGGKGLSSVRWYDNTSNIYYADTISSPASVSLIAGDHGSGAGANQFGFPGGGITIDAQGSVYIADGENDRIQKWAVGATSGTTVAGGHGRGNANNQLARPKDVFVDAAGNIYIADEINHRVQKWAPHATRGFTVAGGHGGGSAANQLNAPQGVYVDADGNVYVADTYNYRVQKWAPGATAGVTVAGGNGYGMAANQFTEPTDVYLDAAKNIYVLDDFSEDGNYQRVQKWAAGAITGTTIVGGHGVGTGADQFGYLLAIYVDKFGNLYTTDNGMNGDPIGRVQKWLPGAEASIVVAGGAGTPNRLIYPTGVTVDSTGAIYVLDGSFSPRVQKYIPANGIVNRKFIPAQPGSYSVFAEFKNGCSAHSDTVIIRAKPGTPGIIPVTPGGRGNLCEGGTHTYYVYAWDDVTTYTWKIPNAATLVANNNDSIDISVPAGFTSGALIVSGRNVCGTSGRDTIFIVGKPVNVGNVTGAVRITPNQAGVPYSIVDKGDTYTWAVPPGALIEGGQGTAQITVTWGATAGSIFVTASNACGSSPQKEKVVTLKTPGLLAEESVADAKTEGNTTARIFPNPAKNIATILVTAKNNGKYIIKLQDISGRTLLQKETTLATGANTINLDVSHYAKGLYLINLSGAYDNISFKLVKE